VRFAIAHGPGESVPCGAIPKNPPALDDLGLAQAFTHGGVEAEILENGVAMLAERGGAGAHARRGAREFCGGAGERCDLAVLLRDVLEHIAFANVEIACGFGVCAHGTGWNSRLGACGDHAGKGFIRAPFGDEAVGLIAAGDTGGGGGEIGMGAELVVTDHVRKHAPMGVEEDAEEDLAVAAIEDLDGRGVERIVAEALQRVADRAKREEAVGLEEDGVKEGDVDMLAFAGLITMADSGDGAERAVQAGEIVAQISGASYGRAVGRAVERHEA
jgi:hypothetical protein